MAVVVPVLGVVLALVGVTGVIGPRSLSKLFRGWKPGVGFARSAIGVVLGAVFIAVAPDCRDPLVVRIVGVVSIVKAIGLPLMGRARQDAYIEWRLDPEMVRLSSFIAIPFGAYLLFYAGP